MITLVTICSIYDYINLNKKNQSLREEIFLCFSTRRNLKSIFSANYRHRGFDALHILRFAFSTIASTGHRHIQILHVSNVTGRFFESVNAINLEKIKTTINIQYTIIIIY